MATMQPALAAGFAQPVSDAQTVFRSILDAMSRPGTIATLCGIERPVSGLEPAAAAVLLTLADYETPVWLDVDAQARGSWLTFHTGARVTTATAQAAFAVVDGGGDAPRLDAFEAGDDRYPDKSATVIVTCAALTGGAALTCSGPGIDGARTIGPRGLRVGFWDEWAANTALYPRGVDLVLVSGADILCLPRTTQVVASATGRR